MLLKSAVNKNDDDDDEKRYWNFLGVWGSVKPRKLKKFMKLTWNWIWNSRGWWGGTDIFWITQLQKLAFEKKKELWIIGELYISRAEVMPCNL